MTDRFCWHPAASLFGADGAPVRPVSLQDAAVMSGDGGAPALSAAMARAERGAPFRIGALDQPAPQGPGMFETLTSGTSGQPRRILRTAASWTASFGVNATAFGIGPGARVAVLGQLVQSLALYAGIEGLHLGAAVHLLDALRPDRQALALAGLGITHLYATPAQLRLVLSAPGPILPLRHVLIGGAKLDAALLEKVQARAPAARIAEFYGAAETSFITLSGPDLPTGSVGRAYPGVDLCLRGPDGAPLPDDAPLPDGAQGAVWVRSPYLFEGYGDGLPGPAQRDGDWLSVGEIGTLRGGCLFLAGRAGRMVTVADQNVFPEAIETFLASCPGIDRVAVLPRRDRLRGTVLVAVVMGDPACHDAILRAVRGRFGALIAPRALIWRAEWADLPSGKTDLARLAQDVAS